MPVNREAPRDTRRLRDVSGWVFPDERRRSDSATGTNTNSVGTNTGVTALQQLRFLVSKCFGPGRLYSDTWICSVYELRLHYTALRPVYESLYFIYGVHIRMLARWSMADRPVRTEYK